MGLTIFSDKEKLINKTINSSLWLKYTFLSYAQAIFYNYDEFKWDLDRKKSKIIIQDKYAANNENPEKKPQIIFNRGPYSWVRTTIDSVKSIESIDLSQKHKKVDLIRSSASFSCIANNSAISEHIADILWLGIYSFREKLKEAGIHYINTINIGECNPIKLEIGQSKVELFNTPIYIDFSYQIGYEKNINYGGFVFSLIPCKGYEDYIFVGSGIYNKKNDNYISFGSSIYDPISKQYYTLGSGVFHNCNYIKLENLPYTENIICSGLFAITNIGNPPSMDMIGLTLYGFYSENQYDKLIDLPVTIGH